VPRRRLSSDAQSERLIDLLVASRLVTSDSGVVEIAHEALAGQWPRLRAWLDDDMEGQRILHHLTGAADAWNSMGRPDSELYRGPRLTRALHWKVGEDVTLTEVEVAFLDASERSDRIERRAEEARARAQARLIRRLRLALVGGTLMLVAALAAGGFAIRQKGTAEESADAALAAQTAADARRVAARALATDDLDLAMLLGVAGVQLDDSPETRSSLLAVLGGHPELIASTPMAGSRILWLDVSPDGRTVATYDTASHVRVYDIASGQLISELQAGKAAGLTWESGQARFSPDGRTLAVVVAAPTRHPVILLDADTLDSSGIELGGTSRWRWQFLDMAYSGDGSHLAATMWRVRGGDDRPRPTASWAFVWDLQQPGRPVARIRLGNGAPGVALSFDGRVLYTTMPSLTRHDLTSGRSAAVKDGEPVERLATSPDGRVMAGAAHGGLVLLDPVTGELQRRLSGNGDAGYYVSFSDDGSRVATVTFDRREAVVWEVSSGRVVARMPLGESGEVVDFSPDGATAYTAGSNHSLRHWDLDGQHRFLAQVAAVPAGRIGNIEAVQPAPGGGMLAYPASHRVTFLDVSSSSLGEALDRGRGYRSDHGGGSWHPNGMSYALPTGGEIRIWNAVTGDLVRRRQVSPPDLDTVDYGTDGRRLAIGELSGRVTMLDAATLAPTGRPVVLPDAVGRVSLGPDGTTAVALTGTVDASGFRTESITDWNLLDLDAGEVRDHGPLGISGYVIDISPDGRYAAVGGHDGDLLVLDLDTGQVVRPPVRGHSQGSLVLSLVYSADGSQILTTASDSTTVLWDGRTGLVDAQVVTPLRFAAATFATHGQDVLVAPEGDGGVFRWTPSTDYAMQFACTVAGRDLTEAEWRGIFPDRPYRPVCN
jgi:WD40 repeat protein